MSTAGGGFALIGQGLSQLLGAALGASTYGQTLLTNVRSTRAQMTEIRRTLMALTSAQQEAINDLAEGIETLSDNLDGVLQAAQETKGQLQDALNSLGALQIEEAREQQLRESLEAAIAQLDTDVVGALQPLTDRVNQMNTSLQTPPSEGGSPITPGEPTDPGIAPTEPGGGTTEPTTPTEPATPTEPTPDAPTEPPSV